MVTVNRIRRIGKINKPGQRTELGGTLDMGDGSEEAVPEVSTCILKSLVLTFH